MNIKNIHKKTGGQPPEKILQIGEGNFLRAFADWMIHKANADGVFEGSVVLCQPIEKGMAGMINEQDGVYTVLMRGIEKNQIVETAEVIQSVSRCINPYENYHALLELAQSPDLKAIISNTTEAGIVYRPGDKPDDAPPSSYPAKMAAILHARYKAFEGAEDKGLLILPVELIERNGDNLKACVLKYADEWNLGSDFPSWIESANCFANTLVDRIVTGYPADEIEQISEKLGYEDRLIVTCEPFHLWVIEAPKEWSAVLPLDQAGLHVVWTDDMTPYRTRKVRILNGGHTVSVLAAYLAGHDTVLEMMNDPLFKQYLIKCIWNEIIPTINLPKEDMDDFANAVLERFSNPFIKHKLLDISLNSVSKYKARCLPSLLDFLKMTGQLPQILPFGLASLIAFYRGTMQEGKYIGIRGNESYEIRDDADVLEFFAAAWINADTVAAEVLANETFWGQDLTQIKGLCSLVEKYLKDIVEHGMTKAAADLTGGM